MRHDGTMPRRSRLLRATTALYLAVVALITLTPQPRPTDNGLLRMVAEVLARWPATAWIDIDDKSVQEFKLTKSSLSRKTLNNILSALRKALEMAVEWKDLSAMP